MIIDFHTHIFPDRIAASTVRNLSGMSHTVPCTDGSAAQLTRSMKAAGVELSISLPVATKPEQVVKVNTLSAEANRRTKETGIFTFGCMHPYLENPEKELERIASLGMKGIKIHPVYQKTNLDDPGFLRIFRKAAELGMVVVTHAGFDVGYPGLDMCSPAMAARVVDKVPDLKLVLAHMGGWKQWDDVLRLLPDTNCFLDTSFSTESMIPLDDGYYREEDLALLSKEEFLTMKERFGADRLLFGTDSPWTDQKHSIDWIRSLDMTEEEKAKILGISAQQLLQKVPD